MPQTTQTTAFGIVVNLHIGQIRNIANDSAVAPWLEALALEKLGDADSRDERQTLAAKWLATVGRKALVKEGALADYPPGSISPEPDWIAKALAAGKPVQILELREQERSRLASALDWLRSDQGPATTGDWSKISLPQALDAEAAWIAEMARQAALNANAELVAASTKPIPALSELSEIAGLGEPFKNWSWVQLTGKESLAREGGLMGHCVGSYAAWVAADTRQIYSLRDPDGRPKATVETAGLHFIQIKARFNAAADQAISDAASALIRWKISQRPDPTSIPSFKVSSDFSLCTVNQAPIVGYYDEAVGLLDYQKDAIKEWKEHRDIDEEVWENVLAQALKANARELAEALLPAPDKTPPWLDSTSVAFLEALKHPGAGIAKNLLAHFEIATTDLSALEAAIEGGDMALISEIAPQTQPGYANHGALHKAAKLGNLPAFELLLDLANGKIAPVGEAALAAPIAFPTPYPSLETSIGHGGSVDIAKLYFAQHPNPAMSPLLSGCCFNNSAGLARWALAMPNGIAAASELLADAAERGSTEVFELLLPHASPANIARALGKAASNNSLSLVEKLLATGLPATDRLAAIISSCASSESRLSPVCIDAIVESVAQPALPEKTILELCAKHYFDVLTAQPRRSRLNADLDAEEKAELEQRIANATAVLEASDPIDVAKASMALASKGSEAFAKHFWRAAQRSAAKAGRAAEFDELLPKARQCSGLGGCENFFAELGGTEQDLLDAGFGYENAVASCSWALAEKLAELSATNPDIKIPDDALAKAAEFAPIALLSKLVEICDPKLFGSKALVQAVRGGRAEAVELLLPLSDARSQGSEALRVACTKGRSDLVEILLPHSEPKDQDSAGIREAASFGNWDIVERLWPLSDPNAAGNQAMCSAIASGRMDFVLPRLPECDAYCGQSAMLRAAAKAGNFELVQTLIPLSDPMDSDSQALRLAVANKDHRMVEILAPLSDCDARYGEAVKRAVSDSELEVLQALLPHVEPDRAAKLIRAEGFEDDAVEMLVGMLRPQKSPKLRR